MRAHLSPISAFAIVLIAFAPRAFGGRMLDLSGPAEMRTAAQPESTEAPVTDDVGDDAQPDDDGELRAESAEDAELPVASIPPAPPSRWKWSTSVSLGVSADDNIFLSSRHPVSDQLFTLGGHFQLAWDLKKVDSYLRLDYAPSLVLFAGNTDADAFDQKANLAGQWRLPKLTLGASLSAQTLSGGDADVGDRAQRLLWAVALRASYDYSTKTSFEVTLAPNAADYSKYLDSIEWVNGNWMDYQIFPKTRVGVGLTLGYLKAEGGTAQTYQQALVRISNPVTGKIAFHASGGMELRQLGNGGGTRTTPVFVVGANYQPRERTEISLEATRRIYSSASLADQDFVSTGVTASVRQHLSHRFLFTLAGGYEDAQYQATNGPRNDARHDQYFFARPSLSYALTRWMNLELYYQYRRNASTVVDSSFDSNVAGAQATFSF